MGSSWHSVHLWLGAIPIPMVPQWGLRVVRYSGFWTEINSGSHMSRCRSKPAVVNPRKWKLCKKSIDKTKALDIEFKQLQRANLHMNYCDITEAVNKKKIYNVPVLLHIPDPFLLSDHNEVEMWVLCCHRIYYCCTMQSLSFLDNYNIRTLSLLRLRKTEKLFGRNLWRGLAILTPSHCTLVLRANTLKATD